MIFYKYYKNISEDLFVFRVFEFCFFRILDIFLLLILKNTTLSQSVTNLNCFLRTQKVTPAEDEIKEELKQEKK